MNTDRANRNPRPLTRRRFLGAVGGSAVAVGTQGAFGAEGAGADGPASVPSGRFGRIFPELPPFYGDDADQVTDALLELGKPGGILDAKDQLDKGPVALIVDPSLGLDNRDNPTHTAGTTFMGQFMDHDMTFDTSSPLGTPTRHGSVENARTPSFDLDSVYGSGPAKSPKLYDSSDRAKLRVASNGRFEDLPRESDGKAIIADPRNDEHLVLAGLQAAFLLFHNQAVEHVRASSRRRGDAFEEAQRLTRWHYQWMVLHEFLPLFVGQEVVDDVLRRGRRFYTVGRNAFIPVEFQTAAYRMGHSMVRPSYRLNFSGNEGGQLFAMIFAPSGMDLRGGRWLGPDGELLHVGWSTFFDFGDGFVRHNKRIDHRLSTALFNLPRSAIAGPGGPESLAQRNLLRHVTFGLPSGQRIAKRMRRPALSRGDLSELSEIDDEFDVDFRRHTPLWAYILFEAGTVEDGLRLGPVGGRIVAEVIIGLLQADPRSYLSEQPKWRPTLPSDGNDFRMTDFLAFAGVAGSGR